MNILGPFARAAEILGHLRFASTNAARIITHVYGRGSSKEDGAGWLTRVGRYVANSRPVSFLTSPNFIHMCIAFTAISVFGVPVFGQAAAGGAVFATTIFALGAGIAMGGRNLYKHKQMLKVHTVLDNMLEAAKRNQQQADGLSLEMQNRLRNILPEGQCKRIASSKYAPKPLPPSTWAMATYRGIFTPSVMMAAAVSLVSLNPTAVALSVTGGALTMFGATSSEKEGYDRRVAFINSVESARHQLGCFDIDSTARLYKRIVAERAVIAAIRQGKGDLECISIYNQALANTVPPIEKATAWDGVKGQVKCSGTAIRYGFSSKSTAALYQIPDSMKREDKEVSHVKVSRSLAPERFNVKGEKKDWRSMERSSVKPSVYKSRDNKSFSNLGPN